MNISLIDNQYKRILNSLNYFKLKVSFLDFLLVQRKQKNPEGSRERF